MGRACRFAARSRFGRSSVCFLVVAILGLAAACSSGDQHDASSSERAPASSFNDAPARDAGGTDSRAATSEEETPDASISTATADAAGTACASGEGDCDENATCEDTPEGITCTCNAPAYRGDGKRCSCADGYREDDSGLCLLEDRGTCEDDLDCASGNCVGGLCCAQACRTPDEECRTTEGATCEDGKACKFASAEDGSECLDADACSANSTCEAGECVGASERTNCDDGNPCTDDSCDPSIGCQNSNNTARCDDGNPCTEDDRCTTGTCTSSLIKDCSAQQDVCNTGVCDPSDGSCGKEPRADGTLCDDASSCSSVDQCEAGLCVGQGNACGPNAVACTPGVPNVCRCQPDFSAVGGMCVPGNDECATNPCSPDADCVDPSNDPNTVMCTCRPGFEGDGLTCVARDPCAGNPCGDGRGACTPGEGGEHSCACEAGYVAVDDRCVCDLSGTFALRMQLGFTWSDIPQLEDGSDETESWSILRSTYDAEGRLSLEMRGCGNTTSELCGDGLPPLVAAEAYVQYLPTGIWEQASMPVTRFEMSLAEPLPGAAFNSPDMAVVLGVSLTDPLGEWPATRADIQGGPEFDGSAVNGARWVDADDDGSLGVTSYTVPPGGLAVDGVATDPLEPFAARSSICPRNSDAARLPYNYPPAPEGLAVQRIKRVYTASRVMSSLRGTFDSCEQIRGSAIGPNDGQALVQARVGGCLRVNGAGETACSTGPVEFLDNDDAQRQRVESGGFVMRKVADDTTCEQIRALEFD